MIYYRLLRDNKETGPYSEEEMIVKGFKPYDLLWAEGRSAGWQYPSEITAFKKFAPIVEEQPFDRFYKKKPAQQTSPTTETSVSPRAATSSFLAEKTKEIVQLQPSSTVNKFNVQPDPGRHIHVTLPYGNTVNLVTLVTKKEKPVIQDQAIVPIAATHASYIPVKENPVAEAQNSFDNLTTAASARVTSPKPVSAVPNHSADTSSTSAGTAVNQPVSYQPSGFSYTLLGGAIVGIATLVGLGIMIGLGISRDKNDTVFNNRLQHADPPSRQVKSVQPNPATTVVTSAPIVVTSVQQPVVSATVINKNKLQVPHAVANTAIAVPENNTVKKTPAPAPEIEHTQVMQASEDASQHTKPVTTASKINIEKNLRVTANAFKSGAFGGISNLSCTLVNSSALLLESAEVEVDYIQANNKVYKTEKLFFKDVTPGATVTLDAPASSRGIKVTTRVLKAVTHEGTGLSTTTAKS